MKLIRKRRNVFALLFILSICLMLLLGLIFSIEVTFAFGAVSLVSLFFLVRQSRLLYDAMLINDNKIISVPSAFVSTVGDNGKDDVLETVVSTFGILVGSRIYRWGRDGLYGVRLNSVDIDREKLYLTFGDMVQTMRVELMHGMAKQQEVMNVAKKLWYETGVKASITGW